LKGFKFEKRSRDPDHAFFGEGKFLLLGWDLL